MRSVLALEQLLPSPHGWGVSRWREPSREPPHRALATPGRGFSDPPDGDPPVQPVRAQTLAYPPRSSSFPSAAIASREFWSLGSLQVLSHGTLELAKPLIQPSRFIGKETEAQRGELTSLRWPDESVQG